MLRQQQQELEAQEQQHQFQVQQLHTQAAEAVAANVVLEVIQDQAAAVKVVHHQLQLQQRVRQIPAVAAEAVTQLQVKQAVQE
jgi:hypothetical protein